MTPKTKHRSDEVGQVDERLSISVQLGLPTYSADPAVTPTDAEGAYSNTPIYWNTAFNSLRLNPGNLGWKSVGGVTGGSGIDVAAGVASWGAPVLQDTDLDGNFKTRIGDVAGGKALVTVDPANSQAFLSSLHGGVSAFSGAYSGSAQVGVSQSGSHSYVYVDPTQMVVSDTLRSVGFINGGDYEANFVNRSLITKQWAVAQLALYMPKTGGTFTGDVQITTSPVNGTSAINKNYADSIAMGVVWIGADTDSGTNVTLSGEQNLNGFLTSNSQAFLHGQTDPTQNGLWRTSAGAWARASDADTSAKIVRCAVVIDGGTNQGQMWLNTNSSISIGTTAITFVKAGGLNYVQGTGISLVATTISLDVSWTDARYSLNSWGIQSFGTSGSNGSATFSGGTLNIPTYTLAGLGGQAALVSGTTIRTINSGSLLGSGNIALQVPLTAGTDYLAPNGSAALLVSFPTLNQSTTGNAATATKLATARNIQGVPFDGTADINPLNGTGLVRMAGTSITYDNSTYLTSITAGGLYLPLHGTADNSTLWNGLTYYGGGLAGSVQYMMVYDGTNSRQGVASVGQAQGWLGLGSAAYLNASQGSAASTVVQRDSFGYINNTYILTTDDTGSALGFVVGKTPTDNYHRTYSVATVQAWLGLGSRAYDSTAYLPLHASADNSAAWNGQSYVATAYTMGGQYLMTYDSTSNSWHPGTVGSVSTFLGLGSNAFNSTAYLPLHFAADNSILWNGFAFTNTANNSPNAILTIDGSNNIGFIGKISLESWLGLGSNAYTSTAYLPLHAQADTAASTKLLSSAGDYVWTASSLPSTYLAGIQNTFVQATDGWQSYGSVMTMGSYSGVVGGAVMQLYAPYGPSYGGTSLQYRLGRYSSNDWSSWGTLLDSLNYNSYSPTLTGGGASGTWGISVSGNATTTTLAANSTLWNGNTYTGVSYSGTLTYILGYDASATTWKPSTAASIQGFLGLGSNAYNSIAYVPLAGGQMTGPFTADVSATGQGRFGGWYNGNSSLGLAVEVGVSGANGIVIAYNRNTSSFADLHLEGIGIYLDSPTIASSSVTATTFNGNWNGLSYSPTSSANQIVQYTASGYLFANYFNTPSGGSENNSSGLGYVAGFNGSDTYVRSYNSTAVAAMLGGNWLPLSGGHMTGTVSSTSQYGSDIIGNNVFIMNSAGADYGFVMQVAANAWALGYGTNPAVLGSQALYWSNGAINSNLYHTMTASGYATGGSGSAYNSADWGVWSSRTGGPTLGFHYQGVVASSIGIEASGRIAIRNNPGTSYENLIANNIFGNSFQAGGAGHWVTSSNGSYVWQIGSDSTAPSGLYIYSSGYGYVARFDNSGNLTVGNSLYGQYNGYAATDYLSKQGGPYYVANSWLNFQTTAGLYWSGLSGYTGGYSEIYPTSATYGSIQMQGAKGGYTGIRFFHPLTSELGHTWGMFDSSANGGWYYQPTEMWAMYYNISAGSLGIMGSATTLGYSIQLNGSVLATSDVNVAGALYSLTRIFTGYDSGVSGSISCSGWFRVNGQTGLYNASYAVGIYAGDASTMHLYGSSGSSIGLKMSYNGESTTTGYLYGDSSGFGLLTTSGSWGLRMTGGGDVQAMSSLSAPVLSSTSDGFHSYSVKGMSGNYAVQGNTPMIIWTIGDNWNTLASSYGLGYDCNSLVSGHEIVVRQAGTNYISLGMNGNAYFAGGVTAAGFYQSSSRSLKMSIRDARINALDLVRGLRLREYSYRATPMENRVGVIAEETDQMFLSAKGDSVNMQDSLMIALKAVQELTKKVEELECRLGRA